MNKFFAVLLGVLLSVTSVTPAGALESPKCNDLGFERIYGTSGGCLVSVSDKATTTGGRSLNPPFVTCPGGRDSVLYVYFPNAPKSGQLDGLGRVKFEFTYFNDCSTWPNALTFELFLTDKEGKIYPIKEVKNSQVGRKCSVSMDCFPYSYFVNEVSGDFDVSSLVVEGYYKFSLKVSRDLSVATPSERLMAGQEQSTLMEFSNQLWFKNPIQAPKPSPTPISKFCSESQMYRVIYAAKTKSSLTKVQVSALSKFLKTKPKNCTKGEKIWFIECIGSYSTNKDKQLAQTRAKNVCLEAKKVFPKARISYTAKLKYSINLWVDVKAYFQGP